MAKKIEKCEINIRRCENGMIVKHNMTDATNVYVAKDAAEAGAVIGSLFESSLKAESLEDEFNFRITLKRKSELPF